MAEKLFEIDTDEVEIGKRVRSVMGVPEAFLTDDVINSPIFIQKSESYINKALKDYNEELENIEDLDKSLLNIASIYYISYLLCVGMDARLPKQMDNISTKTILQAINWDEKAIEYLNQAKELIDDFLQEFEDENYYSTIAELSDEQDYPESNI